MIAAYAPSQPPILETDLMQQPIHFLDRIFCVVKKLLKIFTASKLNRFSDTTPTPLFPLAMDRI